MESKELNSILYILRYLNINISLKRKYSWMYLLFLFSKNAYLFSNKGIISFGINELLNEIWDKFFAFIWESAIEKVIWQELNFFSSENQILKLFFKKCFRAKQEHLLIQFPNYLLSTKKLR